MTLYGVVLKSLLTEVRLLTRVSSFWAALQKHCLCFQFSVSCMVFQCALPFHLLSTVLQSPSLEADQRGLSTQWGQTPGHRVPPLLLRADRRWTVQLVVASGLSLQRVPLCSRRSSECTAWPGQGERVMSLHTQVCALVWWVIVELLLLEDPRQVIATDWV